jgi:hypothetical protein
MVNDPLRERASTQFGHVQFEKVLDLCSDLFRVEKRASTPPPVDRRLEAAGQAPLSSYVNTSSLLSVSLSSERKIPTKLAEKSVLVIKIHVRDHSSTVYYLERLRADLTTSVGQGRRGGGSHPWLSLSALRHLRFTYAGT